MVLGGAGQETDPRSAVCKGPAAVLHLQPLCFYLFLFRATPSGDQSRLIPGFVLKRSAVVELGGPYGGPGIELISRTYPQYHPLLPLGPLF